MKKRQPEAEIDEQYEQLQAMVIGFQRSRIVLTAAELDLFTVVGEGETTAAEVADAIGTDLRATDRLMCALCALGLLRKTNDRFWNTPVSSRFLDRNSAEYMRNLGHRSNLWETWSTLTDAVRSGRTVLRRDLVTCDEEWLESFIAAMHFRARGRADAMVSGLDLRSVKRVLDLGGGSGVYAMAFARARDDIEVEVFDLPQVTPLTQRYVEEDGLDGQVTTRSGDYRSDPIGAGFDLVFLSAIVHANSPEENRALIAKCVEALNTGGRVIIDDFVMSEDRTRPGHGAIFALNMLVGTAAGDTYTESEISDWLTGAGITRVQRQETPFGTTQMIGWK
jgi:predicted O-methyltransferase YrrM